MTNRVYLCCTNFAAMPSENQWDEFLKMSGVEYEAKACIPIFWLCLFCKESINLHAGDRDGIDADARPYAYLISDKGDAIARIRLRSSMMARALGRLRATLLEEWIQRLEN